MHPDQVVSPWFPNGLGRWYCLIWCVISLCALAASVTLCTRIASLNFWSTVFCLLAKLCGDRNSWQQRRERVRRSQEVGKRPKRTKNRLPHCPNNCRVAGSSLAIHVANYEARSTRFCCPFLLATSKRCAARPHCGNDSHNQSHSHHFVAPFHLIAGLRGPAAITMFSSENCGRLSGGRHRAKELRPQNRTQSLFPTQSQSKWQNIFWLLQLNYIRVYQNVM